MLQLSCMSVWCYTISLYEGYGATISIHRCSHWPCVWTSLVYIMIKSAALSYPPLDTLFEVAPKPKRQKTAES